MEQYAIKYIQYAPLSHGIKTERGYECFYHSSRGGYSGGYSKIPELYSDLNAAYQVFSRLSFQPATFNQECWWWHEVVEVVEYQ